VITTTIEAEIEKLTALCFFVFGLSHLVQPRLWAEFFIRLHDKGAVGSLLNGLLNLPLALLIVAFHHTTHGVALVVTLIGWALLAKSTLYIC
jgi:hypothetical protein